MIAVCPPQVSFALMSARASTSSLAASTLPLRAAAINGVSPVGILEVGVGAGFQQRFDDWRGADDGGFSECRRSELVLQFHIGAGFDQRAHEFNVVVRRGIHDGRGAIGAGSVDVRAFGGEQPQRGRAITGFCGIEQRGVGGCRDRRCSQANRNYG